VTNVLGFLEKPEHFIISYEYEGIVEDGLMSKQIAKEGNKSFGMAELTIKDGRMRMLCAPLCVQTIMEKCSGPLYILPNAGFVLLYNTYTLEYPKGKKYGSGTHTQILHKRTKR
jgi:hypothetical protein